jgi:hypothetical protein
VVMMAVGGWGMWECAHARARVTRGACACSGVKMSVCVGGFRKLCLSINVLKLENAYTPQAAV